MRLVCLGMESRYVWHDIPNIKQRDNKAAPRDWSVWGFSPGTCDTTPKRVTSCPARPVCLRTSPGVCRPVTHYYAGPYIIHYLDINTRLVS